MVPGMCTECTQRASFVTFSSSGFRAFGDVKFSEANFGDGLYQFYFDWANKGLILTSESSNATLSPGGVGHSLDVSLRGYYNPGTTSTPYDASIKHIMTNDGPVSRLSFSIGHTGSTVEYMSIKNSGIISMNNLPTYADNSAASAGGLSNNDLYKTSGGEIRIKV